MSKNLTLILGIIAGLVMLGVIGVFIHHRAMGM